MTGPPRESCNACSQEMNLAGYCINKQCSRHGYKNDYDPLGTSSHLSADATDDEGYLLALLPLAKEIDAFVEARVPPGTDYGVFLFAKPVEQGKEGRIIALTSNRDRVAPLVAQWVLSVMRNPKIEDA